MNAVNSLTKVMVCGVAAVVLTTASSFALVQSTARAYWPSDMPTVVILAKAERSAGLQLAKAATAGLLQ